MAYIDFAPASVSYDAINLFHAVVISESPPNSQHMKVYRAALSRESGTQCDCASGSIEPNGTRLS